MDFGIHGGPGMNPLQILRDNQSKVFRESKVIRGLSTMLGLVPLIPVLFKGQLYKYIKEIY